MSGLDWLAWGAVLAAGPAGLRLAYTWAFLEAILLPLPPEILLIPLVVLCPDRALPLAVVAVLGSLTGGLVSYGLGRQFSKPALALFMRLPGVGRDRILWATTMIQRGEARFIALSPWLMFPYKITSIVSGHRSIAWWRYLLAGALGRGTRLMGITLAVVVQANPGFARSRYLFTLALAYALIGTGVWMIRRWLLSRLLSMR